MIMLWMESHIIRLSLQMVAQVFIFLTSLPHLFALMTAVYYVQNRIRFTRKMIQLSLKKISAIFCCLCKRDTGETLPDRLENSYAYQTTPDI